MQILLSYKMWESRIANYGFTSLNPSILTPTQKSSFLSFQMGVIFLKNLENEQVGEQIKLVLISICKFLGEKKLIKRKIEVILKENICFGNYIKYYYQAILQVWHKRASR